MGNIYKSAIAQAFMTLCYKKAISDITVTDIADACGISRKTFYNYFRDKFDVMAYIFDVAAKKTAVPLNDDSTSISISIKKMLDKALEDQRYYMSIVSFRGQNGFADHFCKYTNNYFLESIEKKHGKDAITNEVRFSIAFYCYALTEVFVQWIRSGMKLSTEFVAAECTNCMPPLLKDLLESLSAK